MWRSRRGVHQRLSVLALALVTALAVAACGSSSPSKASSSGASASSAVSATSTGSGAASTTTEGCGTSVGVGPSNPTGVFASLPSELKTIYSSYPYSLEPSRWAHHAFPKGPWKIGFIGFPSVNSYFVERLTALKKEFAAAKAKGLVSGSLLTSIPASISGMTPEAQISAIEQMVSQGVNLILMEPAPGTGVTTAIEAAGEKGVPVVLADALMPQSKYAIPIWTQNFAAAEAGTLGLMKKGNLLVVRGVQGNTDDTAVYNQVTADLKKCPEIKLEGTVYGDYETATAKNVVQQFLASHPQPLAGVIQQGGMFPGVVLALEANGRKVPPIAEVEAGGGDLSWWLAHKSSYSTVGQSINGTQAAYTFMNVALRILSGQQPKLNVLEIPAPTIDNENLASFAPPGKALTWPGEPIGPTTAWCDETCMNRYFAKSGGPTVE
ncbi:MAG: substrate-binding domain-containing protein [Solirubrobacteraceae bacterium]